MICDHRLGESPGVILAAVQHVDERLLRGGGAGGRHPVWPSGDLQYGSRLSVHQPGIHRAGADSWDSDQYGWDGPAARQCVHRTVMAEFRIRTSLSPSK